MTLSKDEIYTIKEAYDRVKSIREVKRNLNYSLSTIHKYVQIHCEDIEKVERVILDEKNKAVVGTYVGLWMGVVLGLMLSDGYFKESVCFRSVSRGLAQDFYDMLQILGFSASMYVTDRSSTGWRTIYTVRLLKSEMRRFEMVLNETLSKIHYPQKFMTVKYG